MEQAKFLLIYITCKDKQQAQMIAKQLIREKLVACANIIEGMTAIYEWQGEVYENTESILIVKSKVALFPSIEKSILALHTYDIPCIVAYPIVEGHLPYLEWVEKQVSS